METFIEPQPFSRHPRYAQDRLDTLAALNPSAIDEPISDIVAAFAQRPYCFPLQSCSGHFICSPETERYTLDPIPDGYNGWVRYRIAYIALCIENGKDGGILHACLSEIPARAPDCIQFGSASWFWERWANTYVLQVEPARHKERDQVILAAEEARHVQRVRDLFLVDLKNMLNRPFGNR